MGQRARQFVVENYPMGKLIEGEIKLIKGEVDGLEPFRVKE